MAYNRDIVFRLNGNQQFVVTVNGISDVIDGMEFFHSLGVQRRVTAAATDAGDNLALYMQTTYDRGANWVDVCRFAEVAGNATVPVQQVYTHSDAGDVDAGFLVTGDIALAASANVDITLGYALRLKWVITDANANASYTFTVNGLARG